MAKVVDYYLTPISPWAYLGSARLGEVARCHGAEVRVYPVDFRDLLARTGGLPLPKRAPERQAYRLMELERWRRHLDLPIQIHPKHFPVSDALAARLVIAATQSGGQPLGLAHAIGKACWEGERDVSDRETLLALAEASGHDAASLMTAAEDPALDDTLRAYSDQAVAAGVFGSPSYVYKDEIFWGQDRLEFLDRALAH